MHLSLKEQRKLVKEARSLLGSKSRQKGIIDTQLGLKRVMGEVTPEISIRFRVGKKMPLNRLKLSEAIPKKIGRFKTDVIVDKVSRQTALRKVDPNDRVTPLLGGIEIQSSLFSGYTDWGTLGFTYTDDGNLYGFTNYHVGFGNISEIQANAKWSSVRILQPNRGNNGVNIGTLTSAFNKYLDYCVFKVTVSVDQYQSLNNISGKIVSSVYPVIGMLLGKTGAASGFTLGKIEAVLLDYPGVVIGYHPDPSNESQVISAKGDSGSVWALGEAEKIKVVALHYGGDSHQNTAYATSFDSIFKSFKKLNT